MTGHTRPPGPVNVRCQNKAAHCEVIQGNDERTKSPVR